MRTSVLANHPSGPRPARSRWPAIAVAALLLGACGLKGDLYLPDSEPVEERTETTANGERNSDEKENGQDS